MTDTEIDLQFRSWLILFNQYHGDDTMGDDLVAKARATCVEKLTALDEIDAMPLAKALEIKTDNFRQIYKRILALIEQLSGARRGSRKKAGPGMAIIRTLETLADAHPAGLTAAELGTSHGNSRSNACVLLNKCVRQGFATVQKSKTTGRPTNVYRITEKGMGELVQY